MWKVFLIYEVLALVVWPVLVWEQPLAIRLAEAVVFGAFMTGVTAVERRRKYGTTAPPDATPSLLDIALRDGRLPVDRYDTRKLEEKIAQRHRKLRRVQVNNSVTFAVVAVAASVFGVVEHRTNLLVAAGIAAILGVLSYIRVRRQCAELDAVETRLQPNWINPDD